MGIFDLFSKRQKRLRGEVPDVYAYDDIPESLRVQIVHILREFLGNEREYNARDQWNEKYVNTGIRQVYELINGILCREYGVFSLVKHSNTAISDVFDFLLEEQNCERVLDVIELSFRYIDLFVRNRKFRFYENASEIADSAINELNARFKEHGIGYEFKDQSIIRVDSEFIHTESVKPALQLLSGKLYKAANSEFRQAHEHYRHKRYKDTLTWALKSLESAMKAICDKRGWKYGKGDTSKKLIDICLANKLIPDFWQSHFSGLRAVLEGGVPTGRNKMGGHGDGTDITVVPNHLAAYILHMTASTLVFLIEAEKQLG